jgi:hypothetical protein
MAIIDDRPQTGIKIGCLDAGTFFLKKGQLFLKASNDLVIDLQNCTTANFDERCLVQPVKVDIFIRSNIG